VSPNTTSTLPSALPFAWQARYGRNEWWRAVVTIVSVLFASFLANIPLIGFLAASDPVRQRGLDVNNFTPEALGLDPALFLALLLFPFVVGLLTLWICVRYVHGRGPETLMQGQIGRLRKKRFMLAFALWILLSTMSEYFSYWLNPAAYSFTFSAWAFAKTLVVVALMIPLQIAFEELMMRGYVLQLTTYVTRRPWLGLLVSSLLFAALHFQNPEVQRFGLLATAPYYLAVGFFLGLLTILDDGLELALGIHLATNVFGSLFVNFEGSALPTPSIFQAAEINLPLMTVLFVIQAFVFFLLFRSTEDKAHGLRMKWTRSSLTFAPSLLNNPLTDEK